LTVGSVGLSGVKVGGSGPKPGGGVVRIEAAVDVELLD